MNRKQVAMLFAVIVWFAVITQFVLMIQNRTASISETVVRFFSYFTILTNSLLALIFTAYVVMKTDKIKAGTLTAITVYMLVVGIVYQILLRHLWHPSGLQMIADELLHTVNPLLAVFFWYAYEQKAIVRYNQLAFWMLYPIVYLLYILVRGAYAGFYPYPFIEVSVIGYAAVLRNSVFLLLFFITLALALTAIGRKVSAVKQ